MSNFSAINLLEDEVCSLYVPGDGDTGVIAASWGSPTTVLVDKVSVKETMANAADHSAGQSPVPVTRGGKFDFEATLDLKLFPGTSGTSLPAVCRPGKQIKLVTVATVGANGLSDGVQGIITEVHREHAVPGTMSVTIKPYGSAPVVA